MRHKNLWFLIGYDCFAWGVMSAGCPATSWVLDWGFQKLSTTTTLLDSFGHVGTKLGFVGLSEGKYQQTSLLANLTFDTSNMIQALVKLMTITGRCWDTRSMVISETWKNQIGPRVSSVLRSPCAMPRSSCGLVRALMRCWIALASKIFQAGDVLEMIQRIDFIVIYCIIIVSILCIIYIYMICWQVARKETENVQGLPLTKRVLNYQCRSCGQRTCQHLGRADTGEVGSSRVFKDRSRVMSLPSTCFTFYPPWFPTVWYSFFNFYSHWTNVIKRQIWIGLTDDLFFFHPPWHTPVLLRRVRCWGVKVSASLFSTICIATWLALQILEFLPVFVGCRSSGSEQLISFCLHRNMCEEFSSYSTGSPQASLGFGDGLGMFGRF